jgi:hypothetical protein
VEAHDLSGPGALPSDDVQRLLRGPPEFPEGVLKAAFSGRVLTKGGKDTRLGRERRPRRLGANG